MFTERDGPPTASELDARTVECRLRRRAEAVKRDELEEALSRIDSQRDLTAADRDRLERLADDIIDDLLESTEAAFERPANSEDEAARAVAERFDLDAPSR
ncbi:hypothetical protein [Natrinema salsiterrestre]|uniref:Tetrapyrrole biosynthesis glutamyl-tRNA reductase dimerisation domain-containing protein n=1 Tax=Natrinema salsiterrestre TaxID=2950540 RepID=A0A9Q4Q179_9EURY|nr:hypothetical protein [Natrinema salsiterrestre]MDF9745186.1 hypothetical protein [Natrinema salsiterrestre]